MPASNPPAVQQPSWALTEHAVARAEVIKLRDWMVLLDREMGVLEPLVLAVIDEDVAVTVEGLV